MPETTIQISIQKYDRLLKAQNTLEIIGGLFEEKLNTCGTFNWSEVKFLAKLLGCEDKEE